MIDVDALHRRIEKLEKQLVRARRDNKEWRDLAILHRKREEEALGGCRRWHAENCQLRKRLEEMIKIFNLAKIKIKDLPSEELLKIGGKKCD